MAHIYVFSPAGAVADKEAFKRGVQRLKTMGHEVEIDANALTVSQRFAGTDEQRVAAFGRAAASQADLVLISRGGYGTTRIINQLPYTAIKRSIARGTQWMGFSDFTAFQCGLWQSSVSASSRVSTKASLGQGSDASLRTWAGLGLAADLGAPDPDEITLACFEDVLNHQSEGTGWRVRQADRPSDVSGDAQLARSACLWGGNLSMLTGLMGTPHFPSIRKGVLFLEDVGEHPYRIERMLSQLLWAGVLDAQQLIVLGQFNQFQLHAFDRGFNMRKVVDWLRSQTRTPVLTGLPFGHVPTKVCLPFGAKVDVALQGQEALILWG